MSTRRSDTMLVRDVMLPLDRFPVVDAKVILKEALETMGKFRLGIACIVDADGKLLGILTDGDIRRKLLKVQKPFSAFFVDDALDHSIQSPLTAKATDALAHSVDVMGEKQVWDLPVVDDGGHPLCLSRLDGAQHGSVDIAIAKAQAAVAFKRPTSAWSEALAGGRLGVLGLPGVVPSEGGMPLILEGHIIGAIGVSGVQAHEDGQVASAGVNVPLS